jgi:hypothetical protein
MGLTIGHDMVMTEKEGLSWIRDFGIIALELHWSAPGVILKDRTNSNNVLGVCPDELRTNHKHIAMRNK